MIGFEVTYKGQTIAAGVEKGVTTVVLTCHESEGSYDLYVGGLGRGAGEHVRWLSSELLIGDEVMVEVKPIGKPDEPAIRYEPDYKAEMALTPEEQARRKENRLYHYRCLEEILRQKGLI